MGEITKAAENLINRDFHAVRPNHKMLTDITEFSIPAGKVYLSPIIDCFDGMVSTWKVGTNPNAELVNSMLNEYYETLMNGERPIIRNNRGAHYRWLEWIGMNFKEEYPRMAVYRIIEHAKDFFGRMKNEKFYGRK